VHCCTRNLEIPESEPPEPRAQRRNRCTRGFVLAVQHSNLRARASRRRSGKGCDTVRKACRGDRKGIFVVGERLAFAFAAGDLRDPRLLSLRSGVFRLPARVARLRAEGKGSGVGWQLVQEGLAVLQRVMETLALESGGVADRTTAVAVDARRVLFRGVPAST
jgi:hypothetical protein